MTAATLSPSLPLTDSPPRFSDDAVGRRILIGICLFCAAFGRLIYAFRPFDADGAMYIYTAKVVAQGGRFGQDICDNKFPGSGLMTTICWRLLGSWWPGYVLLGAALTAAGCWMLTRTARRHFGSDAALPTLLFSLVFLNMNQVVFGGFQLETLQTFFAILTACFAADALCEDRLSPAFVAGLAAGCAALFKPTGLAAAGAFSLAILFTSCRPRRKIAHLACLFAGIAIPAAMYLIYLVQTDLLREMPVLYHQITAYAGQSASNLSDWMKLPIAALFLGFPMFVCGWIFRRPEHLLSPSPGMPGEGRGEGPRFPGPLLLFCSAWLIIEFIGVVAQRRMYGYHFLVVAAPAALLFGMIPRRPNVGPLAAALAPAIWVSLLGSAEVLSVCASASTVYRPIAGYLSQHTRPGDYIWQEDAPRLLLATDLRCGSRYPVTFLFCNYDTAPLEYTRVILDDFRARRPRYIILPIRFDTWLKQQTISISELDRLPQRRANYVAAWKQIRAYTLAHYHPEIRLNSQTLYRRVDSLESLAWRP